MPDRVSAPSLVVNGVALQAGADDPVGVLSNIVINWGNDSVTEDPKAATLTGTILYRGAVDTLVMSQGTLVELWQDVDGTFRCPFSGRIRSMTAALDEKNRLRVHFTATDLLADLENTYVATDWHSDDNNQADMPVVDHIVAELNARGWEVDGLEDLPAPLGPSSATFYNSVKITTLLRRYLAQFGPRATFWDSSWTSQATGVLNRRLTVGYLTDTSSGLTLSTFTDGQWWSFPTNPGDPYEMAYFPASEVLQDINWQSSPENLLTSARVSFQRTRLEELDGGEMAYVTGLDESNHSRGASWTDQYGVRTIEVETMTFVRAVDGTYDRSVYADIAQEWMVYNSDEWRPESVTLRTVASLDTLVLSNLIGKESRPRMFISIAPILVSTPRGMVSSIRGITTGGTMTWDHREGMWSMTFNLSDTVPVSAPDWRFEDIAVHPDADINAAPAELAGETRFAEFALITEII